MCCSAHGSGPFAGDFLPHPSRRLAFSSPRAEALCSSLYTVSSRPCSSYGPACSRIAIRGGSDHLTGSDSFVNNPLTSDPVRYARNAAILEEDPTLGIASPTVAWADTAFRAMHTFREMSYPSEIRQPILMLAASNDTIVSTSAIEEFAYHLRAGSHLVIAGSKHEILQEQDRYRAQFWAAFDAFVPGTPLFK